jgi:dephospho-CoA kinase
MKLKPELISLTKEKRLHQLGVPVIGLTGGISTGKSTVAQKLTSMGFLVLNADLLVKDIYSTEEAKIFIQGICPEAWVDEKIDFKILRERVFKSTSLKGSVESFIYKRLPGAFLTAYEKADLNQIVVYDVPLLFERHLDELVDFTVVVYAPVEIQRARLMKRDGHIEEMAQKIIDQQIDIEEKKTRADFVIDNSRTEAELQMEVDSFVRKILVP